MVERLLMDWIDRVEVPMGPKSSRLVYGLLCGPVDWVQMPGIKSMMTPVPQAPVPVMNLVEAVPWKLVTLGHGRPNLPHEGTSDRIECASRLFSRRSTALFHHPQELTDTSACCASASLQLAH